MPDNEKGKLSLNLNSIFILIMLIAFIFTAGANYGALVSLKGDVKDMKVDYARKDVLDVRLAAIEKELRQINETLKSRQ